MFDVFIRLKNKLIDIFATIDTREVLTFLSMIMLISIIVILFHFSAIQQRVRNTSRCYKQKMEVNLQGKYTATAQSDITPVYKITYDFPAKQTTLECACPSGNVTNEFTNIPYFDLKTKSATRVQQYCQCDKDYESHQLIYTGYPNVIQYMYNPDDPTFQSFFKPIYNSARINI